ncbi:hypothetical protein FRZ67_13215 [Panacibacter ginsenosidivorans]|uniref:Sensor of ECF-type sigma factor n=1 Tax=Panacibacter ginsenosidivorans TaxID=1813871 RepID=A0A5B8V9V8_9BACT|nr:hypothetical protein [Panacibacter ginsenosidivorans]QEC68214.1 hypothetical protein FRZ67_13215 [Panacibacter ginsenosidivorans]
MKKFFIIVSLLFLGNYICVAQTQSIDNSNKAEDVTVAYMTKELNLTPDESKKFWPVYNNYFNEIRQAKATYGNDEVAFEEKKLQIRKKYQGQFRTVLNSDKRVNKVFVSEKNLRDLFKKEWQDRQRRKRLPGIQQRLPKNGGVKSRKVN